MTSVRMHAASLLAAIAVLLQACQTGPDVRADYDRSADFAAYRTFAFMNPTSTDKQGYSTLVTQHLKTAVTSEMEQRGYRLDPENPDLLVNFSGKLQEKQEIESTPAVGAYYGYRSGLYGVWPGYVMGGDVYTEDYTEGTLNIDVIDASRKQMVWEGVAVGEVRREDLKDPGPAIDQAVSEIFARYPFQAGQAQPVRAAEKNDQ